MTVKKEKALKKSIGHWRQIVKAIKNHLGDPFTVVCGKVKVFNAMIFQYDSDACKLCELFIYKGCKGCPVKMKTKLTACEGSPWRDFASHIFKIEVIDKPLLKLAMEELNFLVKLLPKKGKNE